MLESELLSHADGGSVTGVKRSSCWEEQVLGTFTKAIT